MGCVNQEKELGGPTLQTFTSRGLLWISRDLGFAIHHRLRSRRVNRGEFDGELDGLIRDRRTARNHGLYQPTSTDLGALTSLEPEMDGNC